MALDDLRRESQVRVGNVLRGAEDRLQTRLSWLRFETARSLAALHSPYVHPQVLTRRLTVEVGPLIAFLIGFYAAGILAATAIFMAATATAAYASQRTESRWPVLPLVSLALVLLFGGLTLVLADPTFIMVRPTVVNVFFGAVLGASLLIGRPLLKTMLAPGLRLSDQGWEALTLRFSLFLLAIGFLNEVVWRGLGVEVWVIFKVFGTMPLNILFVALQLPLVRAHGLPRT
jgi:intracellular septation protein